MSWRPMNSLANLNDPKIGLRAQVNTIAPNRSKASDGLVGDENHEPTSGHYPHYVAGVGDEIVTAWDCTNDPANGCDSRHLAETLRQHRDPRIRYVISERQIFSSYSTSSRPAWTWGPYSGDDPHENHAHIQVLDDPISDTTTPWDLEGFDMSTGDEVWRYNFGSSQNPRYAIDVLKDAAASPSNIEVQNMINAAIDGLMTKEQADVLTQAVKDLTLAVQNSTGAAGNYDAVLTRRPE